MLRATGRDVEWSPRRARPPSSVPAAIVALCALSLTVLGIGAVLVRSGSEGDVAVGTAGQAGPAPSPDGVVSPTPPTTAGFSPTPPVEVRREQASRSAPVSPTSGPAADPCGSRPALTEYTLAGGGSPSSLAAGDGGSVWFVDQVTPSIGHIDVTGAVTRYVLPVTVHPGSIARGPNGDLWFTDAGVAPGGAGAGPSHGAVPAIGRITPGGDVRLFPLPTTDQNPVGGPGMGSLPLAITAGPDGAMWFTEAGADQIGRITAEGVITEFALPSRTRMHAAPSDIVTGPDGAVWFGQALRDSLGRIDVTTFAISEFPILPPGSGLVRANTLAAGPAGALWFEDPRNRTIGRMTTGGAVDAVPLPATADHRPWAVTAGADGNLWFIEGRDGRVMRVTPAGAITEFPPIDGLRTATASQLAVASDGAVWFAVGNGNRIGRITCSRP